MNIFPGFDNIKQFYDWGCYSVSDLVDYVKMGCLTKQEFEKICGSKYPKEA
ncbi:XkdX family protein [Enterococcus hirae]